MAGDEVRDVLGGPWVEGLSGHDKDLAFYLERWEPLAGLEQRSDRTWLPP